MSYFNPVEVVNEKVNEYFRSTKLQRDLIKKHSSNLNKTGDFNFPLKLSIWKQYEEVENTNKTIFSILGNNESENEVEEIKLLKLSSEKWNFPKFSEITIREDRCYLYLERSYTTKLLLNEVFNNSYYGKYPLKYCYQIENIDFDENSSVSKYRCLIVRNCIENLLKFSEIDSNAEDSKSIKFCTVVGIDSKQKENDSINLKCGYVTDPQTNKLGNISYADYYTLRSTDMQLIAMHKYGIRVKDDNFFKKLIHQLGDAAVKIDLLEIKHTSPVNLIRNGQGASKGAAFILYNSARIETLLRTYEERNETGQLPKLPKLDEIDFSLLKEEEEWQLIFNYVLTFPDLIKRCLENIDSGKCSIHLIPQFLNGLVSLFSIYYRRVRILTENRLHLMPVLLARIYLLKVLKIILNICLSFVDISPVKRM